MDFICEALQKRHPFYSKAKHLFKADELEDKKQIQASVKAASLLYSAESVSLTVYIPSFCNALSPFSLIPFIH